jgi:transposase
MISKRVIFEIHQLHSQGHSKRAIAKQLRVDRQTVAKYIATPDITTKKRAGRSSKLDPYRDRIKLMLEQWPKINAPVVLQKISEQGFEGGITIVRAYLQQLRGESSHRQVFIRYESKPGEQMQIDWGHLPSIGYEGIARKLYMLAVIESHSRRFFLYFSHSQKQEYLHMGLLQAFTHFGGTPQTILVDNMLTAVTERVGGIIRFNESFLDFLRPLNITPRACNVRAPQEKGKVESVIKYVRQNFMPLRTFQNLNEITEQASQWNRAVADTRVHQTTGEKPIERFRPESLRALPVDIRDARETITPLVHKDFSVRFDGNSYTVPPYTVGKKITLKADLYHVWAYRKEKLIATHNRCCAKKKRIELPSHQEQVKKMRKKLLRDKQVTVFLSLGQSAADYLEKLMDARQPIKKNVSKMIDLKKEYGESSLRYALGKCMDMKLYGADYISNILYQEMTPDVRHPPVNSKIVLLMR